MDKIKKLIDEELEKEIGSLEDIPFISDDQEKAIKSINTLLERRIDIAKIEKDEEIRIRQFEDEQKDRRNKLVLASLKLGSSVALALLCLKFEESGSISGFVSRIFMNDTIKS